MAPGGEDWNPRYQIAPTQPVISPHGIQPQENNASIVKPTFERWPQSCQ